MTEIPPGRNYYRSRPKGCWHRVPVWMFTAFIFAFIGLCFFTT